VKESNRIQKNLTNNENNKYLFRSSSEGCKFRFFNKKYSSSIEKKKQINKNESKPEFNNEIQNADNYHHDIKINKTPKNKNKIVNPMIRSVPFNLHKSEEYLYKSNNPEYHKIKSNYTSSSNNFFSDKGKLKPRVNSAKKETNSKTKTPIYKRLYDDHLILKNKHERLAVEMTPTFSPTLYKPIKRITFENFFV
jgi:hypothetical protein